MSTDMGANFSCKIKLFAKNTDYWKKIEVWCEYDKCDIHKIVLVKSLVWGLSPGVDQHLGVNQYSRVTHKRW